MIIQLAEFFLLLFTSVVYPVMWILRLRGRGQKGCFISEADGALMFEPVVRGVDIFCLKILSEISPSLPSHGFVHS